MACTHSPPWYFSVFISGCWPAGSVDRVFIRCDVFQEIKAEVHDLRKKIKEQCSRIPMESLLEIPYLFSLFTSLFKLVTSQGNRMKVVIKFVLVQTVLHENRKHSLVMNIEFWCCSWNVFANSECGYMRPFLASSTTIEWTWIKTTWWYIDSNQSNSEQGYMHAQLS